jgi:hypothetical protein
VTEITILIIGIGIGYFWAMWRVDNIRINGMKVYTTVNAKEFWEQAEAWKKRQDGEPS